MCPGSGYMRFVSIVAAVCVHTCDILQISGGKLGLAVVSLSEAKSTPPFFLQPLVPKPKISNDFLTTTSLSFPSEICINKYTVGLVAHNLKLNQEKLYL